MISSGRATFHELQTVYGLKDLYDLLEVVMVDVYNRRKLEERAHHGR